MIYYHFDIFSLYNSGIQELYHKLPQKVLFDCKHSGCAQVDCKKSRLLLVAVVTHIYLAVLTLSCMLPAPTTNYHSMIK